MKDELKTDLELSPVLKAPIEKGDELGRAAVTYDGKTLTEISVVAGETVPEAGLFSRLWDAIMLFFINLFSSSS